MSDAAPMAEVERAYSPIRGDDLTTRDFATATRVSVRDLVDMPNDMVAMMAAARDLSYREFGVWSLLRMHFWMYGTFPVGFRSLAKIASIGPAAFERMAPALARHFDRTSDGRWTDHALSRARGNRLVTESVEAQETDLPEFGAYEMPE